MNTIPESLETTEQSQDRLAKLKSEAVKLKSQATDKARIAAEDGKSKAVETLGSVSKATREAAEQMRGSKAEPFAEYVTSAADSIEDFAGRMETKSIDDIIRDTRDSVRRSPALMIGLAAAAGFLIARFLKSSSRDDDNYQGRY